ncbi:MAG: hypothetical protein LBJ00_03915 [Planctomycetaceae bacterium]|nr:hypothetical protein [Planctomycetaceae bacterium]
MRNSARRRVDDYIGTLRTNKQGAFLLPTSKFSTNTALLYTQAVLKFTKLNTQSQHREAVVHGRSLPPVPASV